MLRTGFIAAIVSLILIVAGCNREGNKDKQLKRAKTLEHLIKTFSSDINGEEPRETPVWESWLRRTGELPPDFDELQASAFPQDLLSFTNGTPVEKPGQWPARVQEIREILGQYMFGKWPPPPPKIAVKYDAANVEETDLYSKRNVQLYFAPSLKAVEYAERAYGYSPRQRPERVSDRSTTISCRP